MPRSAGQKVKLLYLEKIFREESDEAHPLTVNDIIAKLAKNDISAERKAIYADIEVLRDIMDMDICTARNGSQTAYYLASDTFQFEELQLLCDAVACSKFITEKKSRELINTLSHLTSNFRARELQRNIIVANRVKTVNERIFYNVQAIHNAIDSGKKITFRYFRYDIKKNKVYKSDGRYTLSPYSLAWEDENYYCIGYYEKYDSISNFRVDRMEDVEVSDEAAEKNKEFSIGEYSRKVFGMFASGKTEMVKLCCDNSLTSVIMDKFGSDIVMHKADDSHFFISKEINVSPTFFGWLFQLGDKVSIVSPESLRSECREYIENIGKQYSDDKD